MYLHKKLKLSFHPDIHSCVDLKDDITIDDNYDDVHPLLLNE